MPHTTLTQAGHCWCRSVRQTDLIGTNALAVTLPDLTSPSGPVVAITGQDHTRTPSGHNVCWLVIDGWLRWPIHAADRGNALTVETTDQVASLHAAIREPISHDGPLTLDDAASIASNVDGRYQLAGLAIPRLSGGSTAVRRAFTPRQPVRPSTARSYYTRGRVRRVPETGRWAADQGWAGTTRSLGEHETQEEADAAVRTAIDRAWERLEEWLRSVVHGDWQLVRMALEEIAVVDRLTGPQAAAQVGVDPVTWRAYVSRGQAPQPDGRDPGTDRPWWHRKTVTAWQESRRGLAWRADASPTGQA